MKSTWLVLFVLLVSLRPASAVLIAEKGVARTVIVVDAAATATENYAARQLAEVLQQITGASFEIITNSEAPPHAIIVGQGKAATKFFPETPLAQFGQEELVIRA